MKRLAALLALFAACVLAAGCFPSSDPPNGTGFEMAVAGEANNYRQANGVPAIGWSNGLADDAQHTVEVCAVQFPNDLHACHDITAIPEDLVLYGNCDESAARAHDAVWVQWANSEGHRVFLLDQAGWPPKSAQGVGSVCHNGRQWIAWAGG